jgi:hypothetical protein
MSGTWIVTPVGGTAIRSWQNKCTSWPNLANARAKLAL